MYLVKDFFCSKDIYITGCNLKKVNYNKLKEEDVEKHLKTLAKFHNRVCVNEGIIFLNISSEIGKQYEYYKVLLKKFKRNYLKIKEQGEDDIFSQTVIKHGEKIMKLAINSLSKIDNENYISLIKRSMKKNEMCLGNPHLENIYEEKEIYINNIENLSFNLVENDIISCINRLIKKKVEINLEYLVDVYLKEMNLDYKSKDYITSMLEFPIEVIKIFERKIYNRKEWSNEEASKKLMLAIERIHI